MSAFKWGFVGDGMTPKQTLFLVISRANLGES
jgi:hypothetical protein